MNTSNPKDNYSNEILDDLESPPIDFSEIVSWWESKRLRFNFIVGIWGLIGIYLSPFTQDILLYPVTILIIALWAVLLNICYLSGMGIELLNHYYFKSRRNLKPYRLFLFVIGTIASSLVSFILPIAPY